MLLGCCQLVPSTGLWGAALRAGPALGGRSATVCRMQLFSKLPKEKTGRCHGLGHCWSGLSSSFLQMYRLVL